MRVDNAMICAWLSLAFLAVTTTQASAQEICAPTLVLPSVIYTPPYDPFTPNPLIDDAAIGFRDANCAGAPALTAAIGWGSDYPRLTRDGVELRFSLLMAGIDLTQGSLAGVNGPVANLAVLSNSVTLTLPPGTTGTLAQQARLILTPGQVVAPGLYSVAIPAIAQSGLGLLSQTVGTNDIRATPITISTQVLAVLKLGVTGCDLSSDTQGQNTLATSLDFASACTLNMGDPALGMANGDTRQARINAQANVNFRVSMISRNGGILRLRGGRDDVRETESVHYTATLNGQGQSSAFTCNATNCGSSDVIGPANSPLGTDLFFQVRINDANISQKRAGIYADTITLLIQPAS